MAAFNLYRANCIGNEWNCLYPHKVCAGDEESLRQAVCQDYVAVEYAKGYRSNENFIRTNCLALDCDNGHSENPEEWVSPEKILSLFPDVTVGFHFSRHHNLPKEGKSARPRFHCFFLIDEMTDPETYKNLKKQINSIFPYFDTKALDAARFFYGTRDPQVQFHEGTITLNECLDLYYPDNEEAFASLPLPDASGIIPEGSRNATMSHFAGKLLKRLGETEEARQKFLEKAASCVPPLEQRELDTIWHSAVRFYRKISQSEDYVSPEEYAARHGDFLYRPSDNSDVAEARVLAEVFSGQMRYSPATDFIVYNGDIWEESKPRAHAIMHDLSDMQLEEASTAATEAYKILEQNGAADLMNRESKKKAQSDMNDDQLQAYLTYIPFESNYLENDHEAIVSRDVWDAVQKKLEENKKMEEMVGHRGGQPHFLYGKVFCECGAPMTRTTVNGPGGQRIKTWVCRDKRKGTGCKGRNVKEEELLKFGDAARIVVKGLELEVM